MYNTSKCLLTADKFKTSPEILGDAQATLDATRLYVPDQIAIIAVRELQTLEETILSEVNLTLNPKLRYSTK
jgi:hypothetical protein